MFQRPLICTDFSDNIQRLANFVPSLVAGGMQQIVFLHVTALWEEGEIPREDTEKVNQARDRLAVALQQVPDGVEVKVEVQSGRAIDTILKVAKTHQADVIILGTPTRSLLNEKLFGSTTVGLAQRTKTPLLVLRPQLISAYTSEELDLRCRHLFRCLLLPYDGSDPAKYLVQQIEQHCQNQPTKALEQCVLCWVVSDSGRKELRKSNQDQEIAELLAAPQAALANLNLQVQTEVRSGNSVTQILEVASSFDISAIAVSSGSLGRLIEWSAPSFAGEILRRSWHPVLFFPPTRP
ncbi:universal stress protein [Trichocoleus sp. FACHB-591]|uniref:universal stress protein n=1 Tax=Trichocoleus sp. FACHB-591 TaxID=2692872 RepID=UPI001683ADDC|nr:universal stress protein [Trichocoleus sp. FACHB-591]MBD2096980.1 universal stress protein [Trichocoleus sp. FACHB-591]